jgi:peptide/nickel transport system permease protein
MRKYLFFRLLAFVPTIFLVMSAAFLLIHLTPGDPARIAAGERATEEQVEEARERLDLDDPLLSQFASYVDRTFHADFGTSITVQPGTPTLDLINGALPPTVSLVSGAILLSVLIGVTSGAVAAFYRDRWPDRVLTGLVSVLLSIPGFVLGSLLVALVAVGWGWFPAVGYAKLTDGFGRWLEHLVLPVIVLAAYPAALNARMTRGALVDALDQSYVRTAKGMGLSHRRIVAKHAAKNAAIPVITVIGVEVGSLIGGSVIVESIFGINGLGALAARAVQGRDFAIIQSMVLLSGLVVIATNILVEISYGYFNPRLRT